MDTRGILHASHRHNFMSPQNWQCRSERNPALDTHGDNAYSPQIPDTKLTVTSKVQFLQLQHVFRQKCKKHNPSHVQRHTLPPQPSQLLITPFRLNTHNLFSLTNKLSLATILHKTRLKTHKNSPFKDFSLYLSHFSIFPCTLLSHFAFRLNQRKNIRHCHRNCSLYWVAGR